MKIVKENIRFERGIDPRKSMEIGEASILPNLIDSNTLEQLSYFRTFPEYFDEIKEENPDRYLLLLRIKKFIKDKITFARYFDWRYLPEMEQYVERYARGRYAYNATPGSDGWLVVFSKIYLPNAEEIKV